MADLERRTAAELDRQYLWHPFTPIALWEREEPLVIERGEGSYLIDTRGRRYLDGVSSLWVTVHGHAHPKLTAAITEQARLICHSTALGLASVPAARLAERLVRLAPPGLERVFFSDNGSTAVEIALKLAFQYRRLAPSPSEREKTGFVAFRNSYHGDTLGAVSVGGIELFHGTFRELLFPAEFAEYPYYYRQGQGLTREQYLAYCLESLEELLRRRADRLGTLIIEPLVQGAGGIITAEPGFLAGVRALCDRYELLLIADEVATGFGRTGRMFACEHERVTPDLLCLAKGLSGGYLPIAATLATGRIYERFRGSAGEPRVFYHGHSFTGNPLAAAVSIASLELFEEERVLERLQPKIELLGQWLEQRVAPLEHVGEVRRRGLMVGIELVEDRASRRGHDPAWRTGARVCAEARRHGVILRPLGDVVVLMPHLSFSAPELEALVEAAARSIEIVTGTRPRGDVAGA